MNLFLSPEWGSSGASKERGFKNQLRSMWPEEHCFHLPTEGTADSSSVNAVLKDPFVAFLLVQWRGLHNTPWQFNLPAWKGSALCFLPAFWQFHLVLAVPCPVGNGDAHAVFAYHLWPAGFKESSRETLSEENRFAVLTDLQLALDSYKLLWRTSDLASKRRKVWKLLSWNELQVH